MESLIDYRFKEAEAETERRYQQIETMDEYLDKANAIKYALIDLITIYDRLNKELTRSINNEEISLNQTNVNQLEEAANKLANESYKILNLLADSKYSEAITTEISKFKEQIEELKAIAQDFKSSLRLSNDKEIQSFLS